MHEAVAKKRIEVILVLVKHGADLNFKNLENKTPVDLCPSDDSVIRDILTGEYRKNELLEAAKTGDLEKFELLLNPLNLNCRTHDGRRSTPLHLAAGYNKTKIIKSNFILYHRII